VRGCCQANTAKGEGLYYKPDGTVYNAAHDDLIESRNCEVAKDIRTTMLKGEWHESCVRCKREDESGVRSRRQYETENWATRFTIDDAIEQTSPDGTIDTNKTPVTYYDLRFGNLCNLKCRMCGPADSSMWYEDQVKIWGKTFFKDTHGTVNLIKNEKGKYKPENNDYDWINSESFWKQVDDNIEHLEHIHTVGGEPMMISQHYELLQRCVDAGVAKNIVVEYNSNVMNIPERAWNIWKHFKNIRIGASIDGMGIVNNYIRNPSKWDAIERNLYKLDSAEGNFDIWISATIQIYNIYHLTDFMKWKLNANFKNINNSKLKPIITSHPVHNPTYLNIKILPISAKKMVIDKFNDFHPWLEQWIVDNNITDDYANAYRKQARQILDGYEDYMMKEDWSHLLDKFWSYTSTLDEIRNEKFEHVCPELHAHILQYRELNK